nr:GNAT family N-acetyltransferase [Maliibacterium massiliense]
MTYQRATLVQIPQLITLRKRQLIDEGMAPAADIDARLDAFFQSKMREESLVEWVACEEGEIVATAAILFIALPPSYANPSGVKGYVTNMYTRPAYRGRGIARALLGHLAEEARARGTCALLLHASDMGMPVYRACGFVQTDRWMELQLDVGAAPPV